MYINFSSSPAAAATPSPDTPSSPSSPTSSGRDGESMYRYSPDMGTHPTFTPRTGTGPMDNVIEQEMGNVTPDIRGYDGPPKVLADGEWNPVILGPGSVSNSAKRMP